MQVLHAEPVTSLQSVNSSLNLFHMILLLSNDGDLSCDLVQNWLSYLSYPWIRLNAFDLLKSKVNITLTPYSEYQITINGELFPLQDINAVWFRKFGFFRCSDSYLQLVGKNKLEDTALSFIVKEFSTVLDTICDALRNKKWLTSPDNINLNKIKVLKLAQECGLLIPQTHITNNSEQLKKYSESLISKSIYDPTIASWGEENRSMMYTTKISNQDIENLPPLFLPSMIQELVEKKLEIRTFYLDGECYSMAIFSQNDQTTKYDFRCYNWIKPNRYVPYKLDNQTETKIQSLMKKIGLNCGSLDFIMDKKGCLYFLEVNPTGQFGMVDFPCNYYLHKKVAEKLIRLDTDYERTAI